MVSLTRQEFLECCKAATEPSGVSRALLALWYDRRGDWNRAHSIAQEIPSEIGSAVHAYLHREEGDLGNASYWYRRAGRQVFSGKLESEWVSLVDELSE